MALVKLAKINENSFWAAWKIEEPAATLIEQSRLSEDELTEWRAIHHPRKQVEWLSSRAALAAILKSLDVPPQSMYKDDKGKPFLQSSPYLVSLANSYPYGVAILHRHQAVGIDIERPSDKLQRIRHKFLNEHEMRTVRDHLPALCVYWAVKEALYKLHGRKQLSLKDNITVHSVHFADTIRADASIIVDSQQALYQLAGTIIDGFFVIYSVI